MGLIEHHESPLPPLKRVGAFGGLRGCSGSGPVG